MKMIDYFDHAETKKGHNGYYYNVGETNTIIILGSFCGLRNVSQIHQWANHEHTVDVLRDKFGISKIPCYYWMLCLLKIIKPESLNQSFVQWIESILDSKEGFTFSPNGKTIRSTCTKIGQEPTAYHQRTNCRYGNYPWAARRGRQKQRNPRRSGALENSSQETSEEWHYYISSRNLTAEEMLCHTRMEWSVETMHWLLDVRFGEGYSRLQDADTQKSLNMLRKSVLNHIKLFKQRTDNRRAISKIMLDCLLDCCYIMSLL